MSQLQFLNAFLTERLTAVALETSVVFERKVSEYLEEINRSNEENKRLKRLLDLVFNPEIKLHRTDSQQFSLPVFDDERTPERSSNMGQEDAATPQIKKQKDLQTRQETDTKDLQFISACVSKSDNDQYPLLPQHMDQRPALENREDSLYTNTKQIKTEYDKEDYGVSEPTGHHQALSVVDPDLSTAQCDNRVCVDGAVEILLLFSFSPVLQRASLTPSEEEGPPEHSQHCERSPTLGQEDPGTTHIKEEEEEHWTSQQEEQRQILESEITVSEPTSLWIVSEPTSLCSDPEWVGGSEGHILPTVPLALSVTEEEVLAEQWKMSPCQKQEKTGPICIKEEVEEPRMCQKKEHFQELESKISVSQPTSLWKSRASVANLDCSAGLIENVNEHNDGMEGPIHLSHTSALPLSEKQVPPEQQDPEPTTIKEEQKRFRTNQEDQLLIRVSEPTSLCAVPEPTSLCRVLEPTSLCRVLEPTSLCAVPEQTSLCRVLEPTSLCAVPEPTSLCRVLEPTSLCAVPEPTSLCRVLEPTSLCAVPESTSLCRVLEPTSLCAVPESTSLCRVLEPTSLCTVPEPTSMCTVSEPTSLSTVSEPNLSVENSDHSATQRKNIKHIVDVETVILPSLSPDCQRPFLSASEEQQAQRPSLGQEETEPPKQEEPQTNQEEEQLVSDSRESEPNSDLQVLSVVVPCAQQDHEQDRASNLRLEDPVTSPKVQCLKSDSRGSEPTSNSQLLSVEPADCSAIQSKTREPVEDQGHLCRKVRKSLTTYSEDFSDEESDEGSDFSNWSDEEFSDADGSSSDGSFSGSSSCNNDKNVQTDSIAHRPGKRRSPASGVVDEPSALSNQQGTELSPSDSSKDTNIQTDPVAHSLSKRCKREDGHSPENLDSSTTAAQRATNVMPVIDCGSSNKHYCLYCGRPWTNISRHLLHAHRHEPDVAKALSFQKNSTERKFMLSLLNKKGNFVHNVVVAKEGTGEMVACSRPKVPRLSPDYAHCIHCHGLYLRKSLWLHIKHCPQCPQVHMPKPGERKRILSNIKSMSCPKPDYVSTGLWELVCGMTIGEVSLVVRNDQHILLCGEEMFNKLQSHEKSVKPISQRLRNSARLLIAARECTPLRSFDDFVLPANLHHVITAVKAVAGYNEENKVYDRPSLALALGQSLLNIARTVELCALKSGQQMIAESAEKFQTFKWHETQNVPSVLSQKEPSWPWEGSSGPMQK
ncbi:uncharacterized protein LOC105008424 isoform X2 [Esox lucius]|uniref:uncharacterized protein LOC105008424 isoform X2 n=1 Tax=Esox lucius TaxID=8010 RepID=UPI000661EA0C|nr:uncharacterized protein LOC105008424 isoform X2 [Esox lucius]